MMNMNPQTKVQVPIDRAAPCEGLRLKAAADCRWRDGVSLGIFLAIAFVSLCAAAQEPAKKGPETVEALQQRIGELVGHPRYASALWGVKVVSLDSGKTLFRTNEDKLFSPASN